jgi:hypothetical protein
VVNQHGKREGTAHADSAPRACKQEGVASEERAEARAAERRLAEEVGAGFRLHGELEAMMATGCMR